MQLPNLALLPLLLPFVRSTPAPARGRSCLGHPSTPHIPPLLLWHGLGDSFDADGIKSVGKLAKAVNPGTAVYNIRLSNDSDSDRSATFFGNLTEQIASVCSAIAEHPVLSEAPIVDALGFSQGGQFLRGLLERCDISVRSLVTFGSQHNGISTFQRCGDFDFVCKAATGLLQGNTWTSFVQSSIVPAQYFRDPEDLESYIENSNFLADVNNEGPLKNAQYRTAIKSLSHFAMFMFENDTVAIPKETAWWADVNTTSGEVTPLRQRALYKDDWLGLRYLDESKRLHFGIVPGEHMHLDEHVLAQTFAGFYGPLRADDVIPSGRDNRHHNWRGSMRPQLEKPFKGKHVLLEEHVEELEQRSDL
ncbi:MAG: hypothetical protein M1814_003854 [Vezdaea aestivalis]|nr:MAG: hypothetical protein M1814_003854 [Vezdaea aestivalis]